MFKQFKNLPHAERFYVTGKKDRAQILDILMNQILNELAKDEFITALKTYYPFNEKNPGIAAKQAKNELREFLNNNLEDLWFVFSLRKGNLDKQTHELSVIVDAFTKEELVEIFDQFKLDKEHKAHQQTMGPRTKEQDVQNKDENISRTSTPLSTKRKI